MQRKMFIMLLAAVMLLGLCGGAAAAEARGVMFLGSPSGIMEQADDSILVSDQFNKVVWRIEPGGEAAVYAGKIGVKDIYGEPTGIYKDGSLENSSFLSPWGLAPYLEGIAVTDAKIHAIRYIGAEGVFTAVGSGEAGYKEGRGIKAQFNNPTGIAPDGKGGLYVADTNNHVIRHISNQGQVSTYAGSTSGRADGALSAAKFCEPTGLCYSNGVLYVADSGNHRICKLQNGRVTTVAGMAAAQHQNGTDYAGGYADGSAAMARFSSPQGIAVAGNGDIYVADTDNGAIRKISDRRVSTVLKQSGEDATYPVAPRGMVIIDDQLLVTDTFAGILIKIDLGAAVPLITLSYSDVSDSDWFKGAVSYAGDNGLFQGTGGGQFSPQVSMSRAMYVTVLSRLEQNTFPDVIIAGDGGFGDVAAGTWYTAPVSWAAYNAIVNGMGDDLFAPDLDVSREQMVTILYRYCVHNGYAVSDSIDIGSYHDAAEVSAWALDAMRWACGAGVIKGDDRGNLNPQASATRAEAAQMLKNFCEGF